jgi:hypothetical protein
MTITAITGRSARAVAFFAAAALIAGGTAPAFASDPDGTAPAPAAVKAAQDKPAKKERIYCVEVEMTGSRVSRQVCKTRAKWLESDGFDPLAKNQ